MVCIDFGQGTGTIKQNYEGIFVGERSLLVDVRVYVIHVSTLLHVYMTSLYSVLYKGILILF